MKRNKTISIILIGFLTLLAILTTGMMILLIKEKNHYFNFNIKYKEKIIYEESYNPSTIEKIRIESKSSDIEIRNSEDEKIKVVIYGKTKEEASSKLENNKLNITKNTQKNICFGLCFNEEEVIILYLPKQTKKLLEIENKSGDIFLEEFENLKLKIMNRSGDIQVEKVNNLDITSTSGDILIKTASIVSIKNTSGEVEIANLLSQANLETTSGDINIKSFMINKNSKINSTSGDIYISSITDSYISSHTDSGDVQTKECNRYAKYTLDINTKSGDITVK